jgi:hypothetical protein
MLEHREKALDELIVQMRKSDGLWAQGAWKAACRKLNWGWDRGNLPTVQKCEKGSIHIGAGRLERIYEKLGVPISLLFDNMEGANAGCAARSEKDSVFELMQTSDAIRILKVFHRIKAARYLQCLSAWPR